MQNVYCALHRSAALPFPSIAHRHHPQNLAMSQHLCALVCVRCFGPSIIFIPLLHPTRFSLMQTAFYATIS